MLKKNKKIKLISSLISIGFLSTFIFSLTNSTNNLTINQNNNSTPIIDNSSKNKSLFTSEDSPATYIDVDAIIHDMDRIINFKQYVYNVNQDEIKKAIYPYIKNTAPSFTFKNIQFKKTGSSTGFDVEANTGKIHTTIILNRFYNDQGQIQTTQFPPVNITFGNFYPAPGETGLRENQLAIDATSTLPQNVYSDQKMIMKNLNDNNIIQNVPITSNINLSNFKFSNSGGYISFDISIDGYFERNQKNEFIFHPESRVLKREFIISGFKQLQVTQISSTIFVPSVSDILPSSYSNNISFIKEILYNNMNPKPNSMSLDDVLINQVIPNNNNGTLVVNYSCSNIFDSQTIANTANVGGKDVILINSMIQKESITLTGFNSAVPTVFPTSIDAQNSSNILAQTITDEEIINYLLKSIENINNIGITKDNINVNLKQIDNITGKIIVNPKLDKYVSSNGVLYDIPGEFIEFPPVTIQGFKNVSPTLLVPAPNFSGDPSVLPSQAIADISIAKNIIKSNLTNLPDGFSNDNIIILNNTFNNRTGTITLSFTLNKYYNSSGILINDESWPIQYISMKGFKHIDPTTIKKQISISGVNEIAPSDYQNDDLISFIKQNIDQIVSPLPDQFNVDTNLVVEQINKINTEGYIEVFIKINCFFDSRGAIVTNDVIYSKVRFIGFATITPTSIKESVYLSNVSNISSADVDENMLKNLLFDDSNPNAPTSPLISNFPKNGIFTKNNIFIRIVDRISTNNESYFIIDVSLDTYYNSDGYLVQNTPFLLEKTNVRVFGFKKVEPTIINDSFRIPASSEYSNFYPSDVAIWQKNSTNGFSIEKLIKDNLSHFLTSYPENIMIKNIIVKNILNNSGTIIIDLQVLNYYNSVGKTEDVIALSNLVTISGFKPVGQTVITTSYNVQNVNNILASSYNENQLLETIWTNKDFIFTNLPSNFKKTDIEVILEKNSANNLAGEIDATIVLHNYFDKFGSQQTIIPFKEKILFSGFKRIFPTSIVANISITKPGITKVLPSDFSDKDLLEYIYEARNNIFVNLPDEFNMDSIVLNKGNIIRNNLTGEIKINPLSLSVFYDKKGNLVNDNGDLFSSPITISGFGSISLSTSIQDEINVQDTNFASFLPSNISIEMLKNIIIQKSVVNNPAPNFSVLDIVSIDSDIEKRDNLNGDVVLNLRIKNYYNAQGLVVNNLDNTLNHTVIFKGFKSASPTIANDTKINNVNNLVASNILNNHLLQIVRENYSYIFTPKSLPDAFSVVNIVSAEKISYSNLSGSIYCRIALNRYYDDDATLVSNGLLKYVNVNLSGFRPLTPTRLIKNSFSIVNQNKLASDLSINEVTQLIMDNSSFIFESLPSDFNQNNIEIINLSPDNTLGQTVVDLSLNYYINSEGEFVKTSENLNFENANFQVTITGFKPVSRTSIKNTYVVFGQLSNTLPSNLKMNDILRLIVNDPTSFIDNPYLGSSNLANDIFISNLRPDNLHGSITFNLSLKKYYDEKGLLVTDGILLSKDVVIQGLAVQKRTEFSNEVFINKQDVLPIPQLIRNDQLVNIMFENKNLFFQNLPNNFNRNNIVVENIERYNNLDGSLEALVRVTNYYDKNGILQTNDYYKYRIRILGFKNIQPTTITDEVLITNFSSIQNNIASHFFNNHNLLENLISINRRSIFFNMPPYFEDQNEFAKVLSINPISYNNAEGYIKANLMINEYYSEDGGQLITNQSTLSKDVKITGFMPSYVTSISSKKIVVQDAGKYDSASNVSETDIEYIIKNQYPFFLSQLPPNFNPSNIVNIKKINANDITGEILVKFSLNLYYNTEGVIISNGELFNGEITITGFSTKKSSVFINEKGKEIPLGTFSEETIVTNLPNVYPSEIDRYYSVKDPNDSLTLEEQKEKINSWLFDIVISRIQNLENDTKDNVIVEFKEKNLSDKEGYIEVSVRVLSYISAEEGGVTNIAAQFNLKIKGLKKRITSAEIKNNTLVIVLSVLSVATAIAIVSFLMFMFRFRIWRR